MFSQVGQLASSKSAMKTVAPELSALMTILRSVGPVISTRRSRMSLGWSAHLPVGVADCWRLRQEVGQLAGVELLLALRALREQLLAAGAERALELRHERERVGGEDLRRIRA